MMIASIALRPNCAFIPSRVSSRNFSSSRPQSTTRARPLSARITPKLGQKFLRLNLNRCGEICPRSRIAVGCGDLVLIGNRGIADPVAPDIKRFQARELVRVRAKLLSRLIHDRPVRGQHPLEVQARQPVHGLAQGADAGGEAVIPFRIEPCVHLCIIEHDIAAEDQRAAARLPEIRHAAGTISRGVQTLEPVSAPLEDIIGAAPGRAAPARWAVAHSWNRGW